MKALIYQFYAPLALAAALCSAGAAQAAAIDLVSPGDEFTGSWTLGFAFTLNQAIEVTSLGVYDSGQDGLAGAASVGLWDIDHNLQLATVAVAAGTTAELDGFFRYGAISPLLLQQNVRYVIGAYVADIGSSLGISGRGGVGAFDPVLNVLSNRYVASGSLTLPVHSVEPIGEGAFLGGNFRFSLSTVPEPSALLLLALGMVMLGHRVPRQVRVH